MKKFEMSPFTKQRVQYFLMALAHVNPEILDPIKADHIALFADQRVRISDEQTGHVEFCSVNILLR